MRTLLTFAFFATLAAFAGCGSPSVPTHDYHAPPDLNKIANDFHNKESNQSVKGDELPLKFLDMDGKQVDIAAYRGKSNVVLVVVKGMPQFPGGVFCPGCLAQVNALTANYAEFKSRDAEILMVFPGARDKLPQFLSNAKVDGTNGNPKVPFSLLLDTDLKAVEALGIRGDLAKPSTYILDKKGNAVYAFVGETTTDRPSVKALLTQLDKLNAKK